MSGEGEGNGKANGEKALGRMLMGQLNNVPMLLLIMLSGGGNLLETRRDGELSREELRRATVEVHELHAALGGWVARQDRAIALMEKLATSDSEILKAIRDKEK